MSYRLFGRTRGAGIESDYSLVYKGNAKKGFVPVYKVRKDLLPFFLFQFGMLIFPSGENKTGFLPVYHVATTRYSMGTMIMSLQETTKGVKSPIS